MKALYNDVIIAGSNETILIEKDHYFPIKSVKMDLLKKEGVEALCVNEGDACYYDLEVNGSLLKDVASSYARPLEASSKMKDYIVFSDPIKIIE